MAPPVVNEVHVFVPAQLSGVMQSFGESVHEKVQSTSHPVPMPLFVPKSHCSGASTTPSPQLADTQLPAWHTCPAPPSPQGVPSATGAPAVQVCFVPSHVPGPEHESVGRQFRVESPATQVQRQLTVHSPVPLLEPSSHSSPLSTTPLPHTAAPRHTPLLQVEPLPQAVPSPGGVPGAQVCEGRPASLSPIHVSTPLHGS